MLLSFLLFKSHIWGNSCSSVIGRKAFNQIDCRILWSHISLDVGPHCFFVCRQPEEEQSLKQIFHRIWYSEAFGELEYHWKIVKNKK